MVGIARGMNNKVGPQCSAVSVRVSEEGVYMVWKTLYRGLVEWAVGGAGRRSAGRLWAFGVEERLATDIAVFQLG